MNPAILVCIPSCIFLVVVITILAMLAEIKEH